VKRLGELLIERGALSVSELHTGLEACRRSGGRLGTHLLQFGFVDEPLLLDALSAQFGVRSVTAATLRTAPIDVLSLLAPDRARRLRAVTFDRTGHHVRVAMVNPRDSVILEEIAEATGLEAVPFVATEAAVHEAIARLEGAPIELAPNDDGRGPASDWDELWLPPRADPRRLLEIPLPSPRSATPALEVATFPGLASIEPDDVSEAEHTLDEATYRRRLAAASDSEEVGRLVLGFARGFFSRVCLFAVHHGSVIGWMARGIGVAASDLPGCSVPLDEDSLFREFRLGTGYHIGPIPEGAANAELFRVLGDPRPRSALLLPISVRDRAAAFLLGDNPHEEAAVPAEEVAAAVAAAGLALEILILRKKIAP
jgi:hypothetical protein